MPGVVAILEKLATGIAALMACGGRELLSAKVRHARGCSVRNAKAEARHCGGCQCSTRQCDADACDRRDFSTPRSVSSVVFLPTGWADP